MKKSLAFVFAFLLLISSFSFVLAATSTTTGSKIAGNLKEVGNSIFEAIKPAFEVIFGSTPGGVYFFARILIFLLVFAIIWAVLSKITFFEEQTWVLITVSVASSLLGVRFIFSPALLDTIILPYTTLAIGISAAIPFVIAAFIIESKSVLGNLGKTVRKLAWIFLMVIFMGMWIFRYDEITKINTDPFALYLYPITAILALLMIMLDGTIQRWVSEMELARTMNPHKLALITELKRRISQANTDFAASPALITRAQRDKIIKEAQKKIVDLST